MAAVVPVRGPDAGRAAPGHPGLAARRLRRAVDGQRRPPVRGGPGPGQGDPGEPADRAARGAAPGGAGVLRRGRAVPGHAGRGRRAGPGAGQPGPGFSPARPVGADLAAAFGNLVDQAFAATYPGHPRFEPGDVEVTVRDLAAVYAHVERAVADPDGRVRLEGDIPAVRRVANALHVGMAGETHFLFGDDRFVPWGAEFERAAARDGVQPQDPVTVGQVRGWLDAIRPELGLRDEVADLIVLAWAALRQRAWYQHGASSRRRGRAPPGRTWSCGPSRCRPRGLAGRDVAGRGAVRDPRQPIPDRGRRGRVHREPPRAPGALADPAAALVPGWNRPTSTWAWPPTAGPAGDRPRRRRAGRVPAPGGQPGAPGRVLAQAELPATDTAVANSLSRARAVAAAIDAFRWDRLGPLRAAEDQADERGRAAAGMLRTLREAVAADEFTTRLGPVLVGPTTRSSTGCPPASRPSRSRRRSRARTTSTSSVRRRQLPGASGRATRAKGGPPRRARRSWPRSSTRTATSRWSWNGGCRSDRNGHPAPRCRSCGRCWTRRGARTTPAACSACGPARSGRAAPTFTHGDVPVRVVPCVSALAVREALLDRERGQWLVVLTDRADDDLGAGVLSHLVWNRLRTPDPWDAVRLRFAATGVEPALTATAEDREIATGLLMAAPPAGWPPAPGGVLTRDHALGAVAAAHLGLTDPVVDATSVLTWTTDPAWSRGSRICGRWPGTRSPGPCWTGRRNAPGRPASRCCRCCAPGKPGTPSRWAWSRGCSPTPRTARRPAGQRAERGRGRGAARPGGADPPRTPAGRRHPAQATLRSWAREPRRCWPGCSVTRPSRPAP